jgi:hypothetical protein
MKSGNLNFLEPSGPLQACNRTASPWISLLSEHGKWWRDSGKRRISVALFRCGSVDTKKLFVLHSIYLKKKLQFAVSLV